MSMSLAVSLPGVDWRKTVGKHSTFIEMKCGSTLKQCFIAKLTGNWNLASTCRRTKYKGERKTLFLDQW